MQPAAKPVVAPFVPASRYSDAPVPAPTSTLPPPVAAVAAKGAAVAADAFSGWEQPPPVRTAAVQPLKPAAVRQLPIAGQEQKIQRLQELLDAKKQEFATAVEQANEARTGMATLLLELKQETDKLNEDANQNVMKANELLTLSLLQNEDRVISARESLAPLLPTCNALERTYGVIVPAVQGLQQMTHCLAEDLNDALLALSNAKERINYTSLVTTFCVEVRQLAQGAEAIFKLGTKSIVDYEKVTDPEYNGWSDALRGLKNQKSELLRVEHNATQSRVHTFFQELEADIQVSDDSTKNPRFAIYQKATDTKGSFAIGDAVEQSRVISESRAAQGASNALYVQLLNTTAKCWNNTLERIALYNVKLKLIADMRASQAACRTVIGNCASLFSDAQSARHVFEQKNSRITWEKPLETFATLQREHLGRFRTQIHAEMIKLQKSFDDFKKKYTDSMAKYENIENYKEEVSQYVTLRSADPAETAKRVRAFREGLKGEYEQCNTILSTLMAALEKQAWLLGLDLDRHEYAVTNNLTYVPERTAFWLNAGYYYGRNSFLQARTLLQQISTPPAAAPAAEPSGGDVSNI